MNYKGISFPFRIGVNGGATLSTTSINDNTHIEEAITQLLLTKINERTLNKEFYSDLDTLIFEPNDKSTTTLLIYQVNEALKKLEDKIDVINIEILSEDNKIIVSIDYKIKIYDKEFNTKVKVGEI